MVHEQAPSLASDRGAFVDGRIPFRIRLGVVGHRTLDEHDHPLLAAVREQVARVQGFLGDRQSEATPVRLGVVSSLANGADRMVVREVLLRHGEDARLEVVLPLREKSYASVQEFDEASKAEFAALMQRASLRKVLNGPWTESAPAAGYEAAGQWVVRRSDVLIALWDGKRYRGRGGTAPTLLFAALLGKPCIWIPTEGEQECEDNLDPRRVDRFLQMVRERVEGSVRGPARTRRSGLPNDALRPLREEFERFNEFNRATVTADVVTAPSYWCSLPSARAGALAQRFQRRFVLATWLMAVLATLAAAALGLGLALFPHSLGPPLAEVLFLGALAAVFAYVRLAHLHQRWLSCRFLAERLRTARYVAPTGADARRSVELEAVFVEQSAEWSLRAFEEVWDSRPEAGPKPPALSKERVITLSHVLADEWIGGQIEYHEEKSARHERDHRVLTGFIALLGIGTVVFPSLHAAEVATRWAVFFSIVLPVAGLSLGAILTVRQHYALASRFRRMRNDLLGVRDLLLDADTTPKLRRSAFAAAGIVADEAGDWLGAMWFLDAEHPG